MIGNEKVYVCSTYFSENSIQRHNQRYCCIHAKRRDGRVVDPCGELYAVGKEAEVYARRLER